MNNTYNDLTNYPKNLMKKPKRPLSSYNYFYMDAQKDLQKNLKLEFKELPREIAQRWKTIKDRTKYDELHVQDLERYRNELLDKKRAKDEFEVKRISMREETRQSHQLKKEIVEEEKAPEEEASLFYKEQPNVRPIRSPFSFFYKKEIRELKDKNKEMTLSFIDAAYHLSCKWKAISDKER